MGIWFGPTLTPSSCEASSFELRRRRATRTLCPQVDREPRTLSANASLRVTYIEVGEELSEWPISTVSRAAIERTINSFATDFGTVFGASKPILSDSEEWSGHT